MAVPSNGGIVRYANTNMYDMRIHISMYYVYRIQNASAYIPGLLWWYRTRNKKKICRIIVKS